MDIIKTLEEFERRCPGAEHQIRLRKEIPGSLMITLSFSLKRKTHAVQRVFHKYEFELHADSIMEVLIKSLRDRANEVTGGLADEQTKIPQ